MSDARMIVQKVYNTILVILAVFHGLFSFFSFTWASSVQQHQQNPEYFMPIYLFFLFFIEICPKTVFHPPRLNLLWLRRCSKYLMSLFFFSQTQPLKTILFFLIFCSLRLRSFLLLLCLDRKPSKPAVYPRYSADMSLLPFFFSHLGFILVA